MPGFRRIEAGEIREDRVWIGGMLGLVESRQRLRRRGIPSLVLILIPGMLVPRVCSASSDAISKHLAVRCRGSAAAQLLLQRI